MARTADEIIAEARKRGEDRAIAIAKYPRSLDEGFNDAPIGWLSGDNAGESIPELLGDLIDECKATNEPNVEDWADEEICTAYENGADTAYAAELHKRFPEG